MGSTAGSYDGWVTIRDDQDRDWGRAQASLRRHGGTLVGEITAPLWMVSLGGGVRIRFEGGEVATLRVRRIRAMDGPVATVEVEVVDAGTGPRVPA